VHTLGLYLNYFPVCPEVECGMGIPRETLRLVGNPDNPQMITTQTQKDCTLKMQSWAHKRVRELEKERLCGFIFKSKSPSSGMERVKVYDKETGIPTKRGTGLFARAFMDHFPLIPVEEEGRLNDPSLRENFIERIFVYKRWQEQMSGNSTQSNLIDFHTRHKLLLLSHSPSIYRQLGKLVAESKSKGLKPAISSYHALLMNALHRKATVKKHTNVLQHIMGYFKKNLTPDEKTELLEIIEQYHEEQVPLIVPITLLNHYVRKYDQPYLKHQVYLNPHPIELKLRNHI
jgi:uncharacterized protein YbgA (DUF1722 family)/uncharacterized protein YbbK (DUF523 family)